MFSYKEYEKIIDYISKNLPILDYSQIDNTTTTFAIIRHDVEFILERAYDLAILENELGVSSTYFFQLRNNCYNVFSDKNINIIRKIDKLGHKIGLHAHMGAHKGNNITDYILSEISTFEKFVGLTIDRFSFHRPTKEYLETNLKIDGVINAYGDKYFTLSDNLDNLDVTYLSDSNHKWKYGYPLDIDFSNVKKLQILVHPFSWTKTGYNNINNFKVLLDEKIDELKASINLEINSFPQDLL